MIAGVKIVKTTLNLSKYESSSDRGFFFSFNGSIELVRDPDTCDVLVFEDLESAWEEANRCQNGIVAMLST